MGFRSNIINGFWGWRRIRNILIRGVLRSYLIFWIIWIWWIVLLFLKHARWVRARRSSRTGSLLFTITIRTNACTWKSTGNIIISLNLILCLVWRWLWSVQNIRICLYRSSLCIVWFTKGIYVIIKLIIDEIFRIASCLVRHIIRIQKAELLILNIKRNIRFGYLIIHALRKNLIESKVGMICIRTLQHLSERHLRLLSLLFSSAILISLTIISTFIFHIIIVAKIIDLIVILIIKVIIVLIFALVCVVGIDHKVIFSSIFIVTISVVAAVIVVTAVTTIGLIRPWIMDHILHLLISEKILVL